jgi:hypothetical protein
MSRCKIELIYKSLIAANGLFLVPNDASRIWCFLTPGDILDTSFYAEICLRMRIYIISIGIL